MSRDELIKIIQLLFNKEQDTNLISQEINQKKEDMQDYLYEEYENDEFDRIANSLAEKALNEIVERNQFLFFDKANVEKLKKRYVKLIDELYSLLDKKNLSGKDFDTILREYIYPINEYLNSISGGEVASPEGKNVVKVVCEEYSPEFQIQILNLNLSELAEPVLDLGCGKNANLVKYLRDYGIEAYGIDRSVEENSYLTKADWFDVTQKPNKWGTIIAHMSFSNHFWYHQRKQDEHLERFISKFNELLNSLQVDGSLIYAPGLPQLEARMKKVPGFGIKTHKIENYEKDDRFYSTKITKRYSD